MFCSLCNLSITKPMVLVTNATLPQNADSSSSSSSSPQQTNLPQNQKPSSPSPPSKLRRRPPQPSIMQIERALGAGSFRDGEPDLKMEKASDVKKATTDLFLGQAFEGKLQTKLRETGEWLNENGETRLFRTTKTRKGILVFAFKWVMPIWILSFLIASGAIKLPFSTPFLDDLLL